MQRITSFHLIFGQDHVVSACFLAGMCSFGRLFLYQSETLRITSVSVSVSAWGVLLGNTAR